MSLNDFTLPKTLFARVIQPSNNDDPYLDAEEEIDRLDIDDAEEVGEYQLVRTHLAEKRIEVKLQSEEPRK